MSAEWRKGSRRTLFFSYFFFFSWKVWAPTNEVQSRRGVYLFG